MWAVPSIRSRGRKSYHIETSSPRFTAIKQPKTLQTLRARRTRERTTVVPSEPQAAALLNPWVLKRLTSATMETAQTSKESIETRRQQKERRKGHVDISKTGSVRRRLHKGHSSTTASWRNTCQAGKLATVIVSLIQIRSYTKPRRNSCHL